MASVSTLALLAQAVDDEEEIAVRDVEEDAADEEDQVEEVLEEERNGRWKLDDSLAVAEAVDQVGRGDWDRIMQMCHQKHKCTKYTDKDKFRKHFSGLMDKKKSSIWKPQAIPRFKPPKGASKARITRLEVEHGAKYEKIGKMRDKLRTLVSKVIEREKQKSTEERIALDAAKKELREKGEERKKIKTERLEKFEEQAQKELEFRDNMMTSITDLKAILAQSLRMEQHFLEYLQHQQEEEKLERRKRKRVNEEDEDQ